MNMLKNYCVEPTLAGCVCPRHRGCGGIIEPVWQCPEHGATAAPAIIMKTHFHEVPGLFVGTEEGSRYDEAS